MAEQTIQELLVGTLRRFYPREVPVELHTPGDFRVIKVPDCYIGIEIEAEGFTGWSPETEPFSVWWSPKDEPSLRDNGVELVSPPVKGQTIVHMLGMLDKINAKHALKYGDLTGLHIHLNMRTCTVKQVANLMLVYAIFEDALFRFSGGRTSNIYCNPLRSSVSGLPELLELQLENALDKAQKYMACNYLPLRRYGTIEFRHSVGTSDTSAILNWINLLLRVWQFANQQKFEVLLQRVLKLNTNSEYQLFANEIFQEEVGLINHSTLWNGMAAGVSIIKEWLIPSHSFVILDTVVSKQKVPKVAGKNPPPRRVPNLGDVIRQHQARVDNIRDEPGFVGQWLVVDDVVPNEAPQAAPLNLNVQLDGDIE